MGIEHLNRLGRNDACWCGSGRKYKKCHLEADLAAHRKAIESAAPAPSAANSPASPPASPPGGNSGGNPGSDSVEAGSGLNRQLVTSVAIGGLLALIGVTLWRDIGDGLIAGLAVIIVGVGYAILRDPPAPHRDRADGTQLSFGINPPADSPEPTAPTRTVAARGPVPPPPRTRRKPR
jgi:hypothetical protein